jgi:hypothetical protein
MNGTLRRRPRPPISNVAALRKPNISPLFPGNIRLQPGAHLSLDGATSLTSLGCYWLSASAAFDALSLFNFY